MVEIKKLLKTAILKELKQNIDEKLSIDDLNFCFDNDLIYTVILHDDYKENFTFQYENGYIKCIDRWTE